MANATLSIEVPEAAVLKVIKALCASEGLTESNANAKAALITHIKQLVAREERNELTPKAIELK